MIRIRLAAEPPEFEEHVAMPGKGYLQGQGIPPERDCEASFWMGKEYWRKCHRDLYDAYGGICCYLSIYLEWEPGGAASLDHFLPKSKYPSKAYEWGNFRLASQRMNSRKGDHTDIIDPVELPDHAFFLDVLTGGIFPNPELDVEQQRKLSKTVARLKLDGPSAKAMRIRRISAYLKGEVSSDWLCIDAPFIHGELARQGYL